MCSVHFEDDQFMNVFKKRLVWNAVPTLVDVPNAPKPLRMSNRGAPMTRTPLPPKAPKPLATRREAQPDLSK